MHADIQALRAALPNLPADKVDFARSLVDQFDRRGDLSPKQWPWVRRLAGTATPTAVAGDFAGIMRLFEVAREHLKYPKIRLLADGDMPVVLSRNHGGRYPGDVSVTDGGPYGANVYYGRIQQAGGFTGRDDAPLAVLELLQSLAAAPADVVAAYGHLTDNCSFCGRALTDERSTAVGYGPICADHYGLPWG